MESTVDSNTQDRPRWRGAFRMSRACRPQPCAGALLDDTSMVGGKHPARGNSAKIERMTAPPGGPPQKKEPFFLDTPKSRITFGKKFWAAVVLALISILISVFSNSADVSGKIAGPIVGIIGIIIGLLLQPSPRPEDHMTKASSAIQSLNESIELIQNVSQVGGQISNAQDLVRVRIGLANMEVDLARAIRHIQFCMASWDEVSPGAVEKFKKSQRRGHEILVELQEKGYDE